MTFPSIRIEGAILSGDLLAKLDKGDFVGQRPADFGFDSQPKLKEEIVRAWTAAQAFYTAFQHKLEGVKEGTAATSETRNQWIIPLLGLLGYAELEFQSQSELVGDKPFRLSHHLRSHGGFHVHIVGARESLDKKPTTGPRVSPHAHLQEYLNLTEHLYGIVTNGKLLRLLRDSTRLIKLSYVEFDLDRMFGEELFADFAVLYRLLHVTRLPRSPEKSSESLLERYHQDALESGARIRDGLSFAVEQVVQELGSGFLARNENLRTAVADNSVTARELHHALLRLIYRLLLMMVAEERGLLFTKAATPRQRKLYLDHYSINRLRRLAERRALVDSTKHDLWRGLRSTFRLFETDGPGAPLGLTGLGGQLFSAAALGPLQGAELDNGTLLSALAKLSLFRQPDTGQLSRVNYGALATEEFGSVYERLLELHPVIHPAAGNLPPHFAFTQAGGNERKTTGSFYTPSSLVECLLDSALDPVLDDRLKNFAKLGYKSADEAVLALKVCDLACGSGHFLIAAAQRIARRLALLRSKGDEPSVSELRHTLREVIGHCIYGVDINPMSVELCKVGLWLEAMEAGKPLSFLDHHIRCGNSLLGATPALIAEGIPDDAFSSIEGDDKKACAALKKLNAREKLGFGELFALEDSATFERLQHAAAVVEDLPDDSVRAVEQKSDAFTQLQHNYDFEKATDLANLWCAAFVIPKRMADGELLIGESPASSTVENPPAANQVGLFGESFAAPTEKRKASAKSSTSASSLAEARGITSGHLRAFAKGDALPDGLIRDARQLAAQYNFFHWHLAFPEVFAHGGFDVTLGNPPWDTLSPDQREFFGRWVSGLRSMSPNEQQAEIDRLLTNPSIAAAWKSHCRELFSFVHFLKDSGVFTLYAAGNLGKGDFNIYRMFVENSVRRVRPGGFTAQIVPAGLYGGANASAIRQFLFDENRLTLLVGCENKGAVFFPGVHPQTWFAIYAVQRGGRTEKFRVSFGVDSLDKVARIQSNSMELEADLTRKLAPDTYAIPDLRTISELTVSRKMYAAWPAFGDSKLGPPFRHYSRELDMGNDRDLFSTDPAGLPVYEGRMIDNFDHRAKTYESGHGNSAVWIEREFGDPAKAIVPQWRVLREKIPSKLGDRCDHFRIGFGDVANPRNERSFTATLIPPGVICGHKVPTFVFDADHEWAYLPWLAVANSFVMDWLARSRLTAPTMSYTLLDSLPFPRPTLTDDFVQRVAPIVLRLVCTTPEMTPFWNRMATLGFVERVPDGQISPTALVEPKARAKVRGELDAFIAAHIFGLTKQELADLLNTFDVLRRRDEKTHGEFLTKLLIIESYDLVVGSKRTVPSLASPFDTSKQVAIPAPTWMDRPLVLPTSRRVVLTPDRYRATVVPHLLYQAGGNISFERFRKAYWLLTEPGTLERYALGAVGDIARGWGRTFRDTLEKDRFIEHLKGAVGRQLHFIHKDGERWLELRDPKVADDEHVIFDARLALLVADLWPVAEPITPLAPAEEITIQELEAVL